jgi:dTMP kinase
MLIAFEGIDGAGKTTVASLLVAELSASGFKVIEATKRQPGVSSPFAREQLHALAARLWGIPHDQRLGELGSLHWIYLNAAYFAGVHHALTEEVRVGAADIVIFDNWIHKFAARVATNGRYQLDEVLRITEFLPQPDIVFLLDVTPEVAAERKPFASELERGSLGNGERDFSSYQALIRDLLSRMATRFGWPVVPAGSKPAGQLATEVAQVVRARFSLQQAK